MVPNFFGKQQRSATDLLKEEGSIVMNHQRYGNTSSAMETSSKSQTSNPPLHFGPALAATFLLRDYENYGLSERVRYHFHVSEVLGDSAALLGDGTNANYREDRFAKPTRQKSKEGTDPLGIGDRSDGGALRFLIQGAPCGIARVLECIPTVHHGKLSRQQRLFLRTSLVQLNQSLETYKLPCCEPARLPLRLNASSRVSFAYETTRIVFLIDGSPSMTATFGVGQVESKNDGCTCPLDRLPEMASTLFHSLTEKVPLPHKQGFWQPKLSITVLAVYPAVAGEEAGDRTSLLVRDWTVSDTASAETLVKHIRSWVFRTVEEEIASRIMRRNSQSGVNLESFAEGRNLKSTSFSDWWRAGQAALAALTSAARPCIIVATDGRSVSSDKALDDLDDRDIPFFVLDLSSPVAPGQSGNEPLSMMQSMMQDDPGADFPLYMSDDREALFHICRTTGGCLWDKKLLVEAARTKVGQVASDSPLAVDQYLGKLVRKHQPHMIRPNAVQWYTLFSLSPLSPTFYANWGHLPPPSYLRHRLNLGNISDAVGGRFESQGAQHPQSTAVSSSEHRKPVENFPSSKTAVGTRPLPLDQRKSQVRVQFSTYFINPVRILGLLMMRVKEGYRAIRYGQSTHDPDKVSIIFHLPLELGTSLYYEASYRSLPGHNHMVGHAHIKIELSGEASFVQAVKRDFLQHNAAGNRRPVTLAQQVSAKLGRLLRSIRREDLLQSYLSPLKWSDQLLKADSPFVRRLGTLSKKQKVKHFRYDEFDCVCVGKMPYAQDADFLNAFQDADNGEEDLFEAISSWSTRRVQSGNRENAVTFVRKLGDGLDGLPSYCLLSVVGSRIASRLFTVSVEIFEGSSSAPRRLGVIASLREMISRLKDVRVLEMQMGPFLMGFRRQKTVDVDEQREGFLASQYLHESWDLVYDKELLPLLMRRRAEIGGFWLLDSSESYALFARLHSKDGFVERKRDDPGDMVQYQVSILADRVVIDLHMESECGVFRDCNNGGGQFGTLVTNLKRRDQECGLALRARTHVLSAFDNDDQISVDSYASSAIRLLGYASRVEQRLRAFHPIFVEANNALLEEFREMLLLQQFGPMVAVLSIDSTADGRAFGPGLWFLVNYDKYTVGILHLRSSVSSAVEEVNGCSRTTTVLAFYTLSISDLYSRREDFVGDDDSEQGTVEEYICMSDFAEHLLKEYRFVYARAAYRALLGENRQPFSIHVDDMLEVMSSLTFCPVTNVTIESGGEKLAQILSSVIKEIPGEKYYYFFKLDESDIFASTDSGSSGSSDDSTEHDDADTSKNSDVFDGKHSLEVAVDPDKDNEHDSKPPIFVRFLLDGMNASMEDLKCFRKSANLVALITVYDEEAQNPMNLPLSHRAPASHIKRLLDAYVAEQTLERLRGHGHEIRPEDLRLARKCLRRARDVMTSEFVLLFYSSTLDNMVSASVPAGSDKDVESGMQLLLEELLGLRELRLGRMDDGSFVAFGGDAGSDLIPYWCFLDFGNGFVSIETHHPSGPEHARTLLSYVHSLLMKQLHRVNQILILRKLHKNRSATTLMIEQDDRLPVSEEGTGAEDDDQHAACLFACPIVFQKRFELFHRCATNPEQVARTVETSVLHVFSISNRRRLFVYKDESGSIFYMRLSATGGGLEPDGVIDLEVHGIDDPTESVTKQLTGLISKKILSIAVDLLSAVLTKNPRYAWRPADVSFVTDYNRMWREVEEDANIYDSETHYYSLPLSVYDPSTVLLYFRQNLCGSTYFHPFIASTLRDESDNGSTEPRFTFYYNNIPSKLSPKLQIWSTLTAKGAEFARLAGQGLALVEVSLVDYSGTTHSALQPVRDPSAVSSDLLVPHESIKVRKEENLSQSDEFWRQQGRVSTHFVKVTITDTALQREVLHDWVNLTLNQVTTGWVIEKQTERQQRGLLCKPKTKVSYPCNESKQRALIDELVPGLPSLLQMYEITYGLPHPALQKMAWDGMVRASSVASVALKFLETITEAIKRETKSTTRVDFSGQIHSIRVSRDNNPKLVELSWARDRCKCLVQTVPTSGGSTSEATPLVDSHIDCPHYLIFFSTPEYSLETKSEKNHFPKLFEGVNLGDDYKSETRLEEMKTEMPNTFTRSLGFILSVKRNSRFLLAYNWRADLFTTISSALKDEDTSLTGDATRASDRLQTRSLSFLSPRASTEEQLKVKAHPKRANPTQNSNEDVNKPHELSRDRTQSQREPNRRAVRPAAIRRPKLLGKSVDGSAAHAVAASRARASFKGSYGSNAQPPGPKSTTGVATSSSTRTGITSRKQRGSRPNEGMRRSTKQEGRKVGRVKKEFQDRIASTGDLVRRHTLQQEVARTFLNSFWPHKVGTPPIASTADFLVSQTNLEDTKTIELLPFPSSMFETFTRSLATFLQDSINGLRIVAVTKRESNLPPSVFLSIEPRKMTFVKCFPVLQLDMLRDRVSRRLLLRCTIWTVALMRHPTKPIDRVFRSRRRLEMQANGPDKLSTTLKANAGAIETKLVEFALKSVVDVFKSSSAITGPEALKLAADTEARYDLEHQIQMLRSEYKVFRFPLKIESFRQPRMNHFSAPALFSWLVDNAEARSLTACGPKSLLFQSAIEMPGIEAFCMLSDRGNMGELDMTIICLAKGVDLQRFMFQPNSGVAITIAKSIAIDAAGVALYELLAASLSLRLHSLWSLVSHEVPRPQNEDSGFIHELLELCSIEPVQESIQSWWDERFEQMLKDVVETKWSDFCDCLSLQEAFSPSWQVANDQCLFYVQSFDVFLQVKRVESAGPVELNFVFKSDGSTGANQKVAAAQQLINFMLHFAWHSVSVHS